MYAVTVSDSPRPGTLGWNEVPDPTLRQGEVLIEVAAAGVNRADLLQARGGYPPPPGASPILGLECSGTITAMYDDVRGFSPGDQVCALLSGGGYAERVAVPAAQLLPVPGEVSLVDAAGLPEVACTVWSNLVLTAGLTPGTAAGRSLLVHGGSSGIGTMALQVGRALGVRTIATASTDEKLRVCRSLGADPAINYTEEDFVDRTAAATDGRGVDVILDVVGGKYLSRNISALADDGRLVIIGLLGGARADLDLSTLMTKRAAVIGTRLRSRPVTGSGSKGEIVAAVRRDLWPRIAAGDIRPVTGRVVPMDRATEAHHALKDGNVVGKVILTRP